MLGGGKSQARPRTPGQPVMAFLPRVRSVLIARPSTAVIARPSTAVIARPSTAGIARPSTAGLVKSATATSVQQPVTEMRGDHEHFLKRCRVNI